MLLPRRPQPVSHHAGQPRDQPHQRNGRRHAELGHAVHRQGHQHHAQGQEPVAGQIQRLVRHATEVGHQLPGCHPPHQPHRHIDQEHPMPRGHLHEPAPERGAQQRANQPRNGNEAHGRQEFAARISAQHRKTPHRQQQGSARSLHDAGHHQMRQRRGHAAGQRPRRKHQNRPHEHATRPQMVRQPSREGNEHGHGQRIRHQHRLHPQRTLMQTIGHGRQGRVDNGGIQRLHEKPNRHEPEHALAMGLLRR